jgi:hypothetical protein
MAARSAKDFAPLGIGGVKRFAEIHFRPGDVGVS